MNNIHDMVYGLRNKDNKYAYRCLKELKSASMDSNAVYSYFDFFAAMLDDSNSYIRTRGLLLISANARWDTDNKIDEIIDVYLKHIMDDKPITARQTIKALPNIARYKHELINDICAALCKANPLIYKTSMQSLIYQDIQEALKAISVL